MGDIPRGDLAVYVFIEMIALGFVLESVSAFRAENWISAPVLMLIGLVCFVGGIKGPRIKSAVASRLPGAKLKREIAVLRQQSADAARHMAAKHAQEMGSLKAHVNSTRPTVVPVLFGPLPRPDRSSILGPRSNGLTLANDGRSAAYDISIPAFMVGEWSINFDSISRLGVDESVSSPLWVWRNGQGSDDLVARSFRYRSKTAVSAVRFRSKSSFGIPRITGLRVPVS